MKLTISTVAVASALLFGATAVAAPPSTTTVGDSVSVWSSATPPDPANGIYPVGGAGQLNGEFVVAENDEVQIGLRITDRTDGLLAASGNNVGKYAASTGWDTGTTNRAEWNYDIHVDLRNSDTTLADYDLSLQTNIANPLFGDVGTVDLNFGSLLDNAVLLQFSQNPVFGNDVFDPFVEATYNFRLTLSPKDGGPPLTAKAQVTVSD